MFLSEHMPLVAIDIGSHSIKLAQVEKVRNGHELQSFAIMPLQEEAVSDGVIRNVEAVTEALAKLLKAENIRARHAVASVAGDNVIIKKIKLPAMSQKELEGRIRDEAGQYIPFDINDVNLDFQIIQNFRGPAPKAAAPEKPGSPEKMEVLLVAVQREIVESRTELLKSVGLRPVIIDLDIFAMMNTVGLSHDLERLGAVGLVDLGDSFTHINIVSYGLTHFTRDFRAGGHQCTEKLKLGLDVLLDSAEAVKQGRIPEGVDRGKAAKIIADCFTPILDEVYSSMDAYEQAVGERVSRLILGGGGALIKGVDGLFQEKLGVPVEIVDPWKAIKIDPKKFDQEEMRGMAPLAAVAVGLAVRRFDHKLS